MPPIANLNLSESLSDTPLKVRSHRALPDHPAALSSRTTGRQDWKREEAKVLSDTWSVPVMASHGRGQAKPTHAFPVSNFQHVDSKVPKNTFTRARATQHLDLNLTSVQRPLVMQNMKTIAGLQPPPPTALGNRKELPPFCPVVFEELWLHPNPQKRPSSCILQNREQSWARGNP